MNEQVLIDILEELKNIHETIKKTKNKRKINTAKPGTSVKKRVRPKARKNKLEKNN